MKAIISHDIDHITLSEHYLKDLVVPKFLVRSKIEFLSGKISFRELLLRCSDIFTNKWENINELMAFNRSKNVPATFFIAVANGVGLNYSLPVAEKWINEIQKQGFCTGIHGIEFSGFDKIKNEHDLFARISGKNTFGIRMHYVRNNESTFTNLSKAGYIYDSTEFSFNPPYKIGNMWQFPFQIMDGYIIQKPKQWQSKDLKKCKEETLKIIDKTIQLGLPYLGIDFHDRYFSDRFVTWRDWYVWLIEYLISQKIEFIDFNTAITELEQNK